MERCKTCGVVPFDPRTHSCAPRWSVWDVDNADPDDEGCVVRALDAEQAAEEWAEGCGLELDETATVLVVGSDGARSYFRVSGEADVVYYATATEARPFGVEEP